MAGATTKTAAVPASSSQVLAWQGDGWTIALTIEDDVIAHAKLQWGSPVCDAAFLETIARSIVGMGLREARDHGVQHACAAEGGNATPAVSGIVIPANYSETSRSAVKALRAAIDQTLKPDPAQWNFEDHAFSEAWLKTPKDTRRHRLETLIKDSLRKLGSPDAAEVTEIDEYDRVFLLFQADVPVAEKSSLLMRLERDVRSATGERIELFVSEMKDNNRIRRL